MHSIMRLGSMEQAWLFIGMAIRMVRSLMSTQHRNTKSSSCRLTSEGFSFPTHLLRQNSSKMTNASPQLSVCVITIWVQRRKLGNGNSSGRLSAIRRVICGLPFYSLLRESMEEMDFNWNLMPVCLVVCRVVVSGLLGRLLFRDLASTLYVYPILAK